MKRNLVLGSLLVSCVLCGCSSGETAAQTKGIVDCYSISVRNGSSTFFDKTYSASYTEVHEFKSSKGASIYTENLSYSSDTKIYLYNNRYASDYVEYSYVGFIGYLTVECNYYLDLDNRLIDSEIKYSEYLYSENPTIDKKLTTKKPINVQKRTISSRLPFLLFMIPILENMF